jgi:hypothetical protein
MLQGKVVKLHLRAPAARCHIFLLVCVVVMMMVVTENRSFCTRP